MSYLNIKNLYKNPDIFLFREVYALEKIHGTSAHISWKNGSINFFAGGEKHKNFVALFDAVSLTEKFVTLGHPVAVVYGEAYGGKCMGMSATYGPSLRFVVFDIKIGKHWLSVPQAEDVTKQLGLEFVHYTKCSTEIAALNLERDANSIQAIRNGILEPKHREGIVIRPLMEFIKNDGDRIIAKHKRDEFMETKTLRMVDPAKLQVLQEAQAIADEWVTQIRLIHILDKTPARGMEDTPTIIRAMIEDVKREGAGEIQWSKEAETIIGRSTAKLLKAHLSIIQVPKSGEVLEKDGRLEADLN